MATSRKKAEAKGKAAASAPSSAAKKRGTGSGSGRKAAKKPARAASSARAKRQGAKAPAASKAKTAAAKKRMPAGRTTKSARAASSRGKRPASAAASRPASGAARAKPSTKKVAAGPGAGARPKAAGRGRGAVAPASRALLDDVGAPHAVAGLSEEDQIRAAKFLPRELPRRLFEEERFVFPETYGINRVRLLVRDPEWIFAYWDVSPEAMKGLAKSIGERALALSRLTLRVVDPVSGGSTDILLPPGARWWYVRTDQSRRTYRAELGVTLPSGEFRRLADSNTVVTPRVGPSPERARRRMSYRDARELPLAAAAAASEAEKRTGVALEPWEPGTVEGARTPNGAAAARGGASDRFRPGGASDTFPGASDTFRR